MSIESIVIVNLRNSMTAIRTHLLDLSLIHESFITQKLQFESTLGVSKEVSAVSVAFNNVQGTSRLANTTGIEENIIRTFCNR